MVKTIGIGKQDFASVIEDNCFFVDKTSFIKEWWDSKDDVTLITRPRRFGKTLNMSMLNCFFSNQYKDRSDLFDSLSIWEDEDYRKIQGTYPVIFMSFASVKADNLGDAKIQIKAQIEAVYKRHRYLLEGDTLTADEIADFEGTNTRMGDAESGLKLNILCEYFHRYWGKKTIIILDEYDTPIQEAYLHGYWNEFTAYIRSLFNATFKTNPYLERAIMTGITRVSKESIFSDLNNLEVITTTSEKYATSFGFTESEVFTALDEAGMSDQCDVVKKWYDGYHFGNVDVYCPWDVINFAKKLVFDTSARPSAFWINSSGNDMVKRFVDKADQTTRDEIEKLVAGGFVEKQLRLDLTYDEIDNTIDNLWSVLFTTGYLTTAGEVRLPDSESYAYKLVIPNKEVREVFVLQIQEWFKAVVAKDDDTMKLLSRAILDKDEKQIARQLNIVMSRMISILDTKASDDMKENFYHGLLLGLLRGSNPGWLIKSNRESGDGFSDILIKPEDPDAGIVIEVKYAKEMKNLDAACEAAMTQIKEKRYDEALRDEGRCDILAYGIAFCRKRCRVVGEKINYD